MIKLSFLPVAVLAVAMSAQGGLLTFDNTGGHEVATYTEDDIVITTLNPGGPEGSAHLHFDAPFFPEDHLAIHGGCCSSPYLFTEATAHPFVLLSITIYAGSAATTMTSSTGQIVVLPLTNSNGGPVSFFFPANFVGTSFTWDAGSNPNTIAAVDNIAYTVPEPSTLALVGAALAGVVIRRRVRG